MNRLFLETSTAQASAALFAGRELVAEETFAGGRGPQSPLFSILEIFLTKVSRLDEIVVGVGPGSYSGIRIGISAAIGLRLARSITAVGVASALGYEGDNFQVILDARGSWIYTKVCQGAIEAGPIHCTLEELRGRLDSEIPIFSPDRTAPAEALNAFPSAAILGRRYTSNSTLEKLALRPLYLREPHITLAKGSQSFGLLA